MSAMKTNKREKVTDLVTIYRRGGVWYSQFMHGGKQRRRSLNTSRIVEARGEALQIDYDLRKGQFRVSQDIDVAPLFQRYLKWLRTEGRRPNTIKRYRPVFDRFADFCQSQGVRKAARVDIGMVEEFKAMRLDDGAAEGTRYREALWVKQVWKYGEERGLVPVNLLKTMRIRKPATVEQPCFTEKDVRTILTGTKGRDRDFFTVLAYTGMRCAELQWLTWSDVDLNEGWIHVRAKDGWTPKNGKDRKLPLHPEARNVFERLPRKHRWVFTARRSKDFPAGGNQVHLNHLRESLSETLENLGIPKAGFHAFRRFFITYCANSGVPPTVLMKWVGHSDLRMIVRYYRLQDDESREAMEALSRESGFSGFSTVLAQSGVSQKHPRSQPPVFQVVTSAS